MFAKLNSKWSYQSVLTSRSAPDTFGRTVSIYGTYALISTASDSGTSINEFYYHFQFDELCFRSCV